MTLDAVVSLSFDSCMCFVHHRPPSQSYSGFRLLLWVCWESFQAERVSTGTEPRLSPRHAHMWPISSPLTAGDGEAAACRVDSHFYYSVAGASSTCSNWSQANYKCNYKWECGLIRMHFTADFREEMLIVQSPKSPFGS